MVLCMDHVLLLWGFASLWDAWLWAWATTSTAPGWFSLTGSVGAKHFQLQHYLVLSKNWNWKPQPSCCKKGGLLLSDLSFTWLGPRDGTPERKTGSTRGLSLLPTVWECHLEEPRSFGRRMGSIVALAELKMNLIFTVYFWLYLILDDSFVFLPVFRCMTFQSCWYNEQLPTY